MRSLLSQTAPPFEIVVSENYSTDGTDRVLARYADRVQIIRPPQHLGMAENWNYLVGQLSGEWFSLLSGDDVALPHYVETLTGATQRSNKAVLVRAGWRDVNGEGRVVDQNLLLSVRSRVRPPYTLYESLSGPKTCFAAFAARHSAWRKVGGFPEAMGIACDWGFWIRLAPEGEFIRTSEIISLYRTNYRPGRISSIALTCLRDCIYVDKVLIPESAARISGFSQRRFDRGRRQTFRFALETVAMAALPTDRPAAAVLLRQLAESPEECRLADNYERGNFIVRVRWRDAVRRLLRGPVQRVLGLANIMKWLP